MILYAFSMCLKKRAQRYMRDLKTKTADPECGTG